MAARVTLLTDSSAESFRLNLAQVYSKWHEQVADQSVSGRFRSLLWISPSRVSCRETVSTITKQAYQSASISPLVSAGIVTFDQFAEHVLEASTLNVLPLQQFEQCLLLRSLIERLIENQQLPNLQNVGANHSFLKYITSFLAEMKRHEIWPDILRERIKSLRDQPAMQDLVTIYEEYQQTLIATERYDSQGRFWQAGELLAAGEFGRYHAVKRMIVDGFHDFTRAQESILWNLIEKAEEVIISLPLESLTTRPLLFSTATKTLAHLQYELKQRGCQVKTVALASMSKDALNKRLPCGIQQAQSSIFAPPHLMTKGVDSTGLKVMAISGTEREHETLIERLKQQSMQGTAPSEMIVVFRKVEAEMEHFCRLAHEAGLPVSCDLRQNLLQTPVVRAFQQLLQVELQDWSYPALSNFLSNDFFSSTFSQLPLGTSSHPVTHFLQTLQETNLHKSRIKIVSAIDKLVRLSAPAAEEETTEKHRAKKQLQAFVKYLDESFKGLNSSQTFTAWTETLIALMRHFWKSPPQIAEDKTPTDARHKYWRRIQEHDRKTWDILVGTLRDCARFRIALGVAANNGNAGIHSEAKISLTEMMSLINEILDYEIPGSFLPTSTPGTIRVVSAEDARHIFADHVFLAGLTSDAYAATHQAQRWSHLTTAPDVEQQDDQTSLYAEQFLFYTLIHSARKELTFSYTSTNELGEPLSPSPCLTALRMSFTEVALPIVITGSLDPSVVPESGITPAARRILAVSQLQKGDGGWLRQLMQQEHSSWSGHNLLASLEVAIHRLQTPGLTRFEGELSSNSTIREFLQQKFYPEYQFSATQLESYLACPYRFMVEHLLKIEAVSEPGLSAHQKKRGTIIHDVYAHAAMNIQQHDSQQFAERLREFLSDRLKREFTHNELQLALLEIEGAVLSQWCELFAVNQEGYHGLMESWTTPPTTSHVEVAFGSAMSADDEVVPDTTPAYPRARFGTEDQPVYLRGRIDRIDIGSVDAQPFFNIIDYKSGSISKFDDKLLSQKKYALQLAMYGIAAIRIGLAPPDAQLYQLGYWQVKANGFVSGKSRGKAGTALDPEFLQTIETYLDTLLPKIVQAMRAGHYPVFNRDENCTNYCNYRTTCRIGDVRRRSETLHKVFDVDPEVTGHLVDDADDDD